MTEVELERAEDLLRQGRYAEAIARFRELLSQEPEHPELRGRVAEAYRLAGNAERAFHHFHKAAALFGRKNDLLGAARMLEAANQVSPNEPDVLYRLAEVLAKLGRDDAAQVVLRNLMDAARAPGDRRRLWAIEQLVQRAPKDLDLQVERARVLAEVGRHREAAGLWSRLAGPLSARGVDISSDLARTAEAAAEEPAVGVRLARILLLYGKAREALALLVPFYERFNDDVPVLEALLEALEGIRAEDKILPARLELLKARTRAGQRADALEQMRALLAEAPRDPRVLEVCAQACAAFGLTGEACRRWFELAELYDAHGMHAERDRRITRILEVSPDHEGALALGARVLRAAGREQEAAGLEARLAEVRARAPAELPSGPGVAPPPEAFADPSEQAPTRVLEGTEVVADADVLEIHSASGTVEVDAIEPADTNGFGVPARQPGPIHDPFFAGEDAGLPEETPEAPEEATSRMDEDISAELEALRAELEEDEATKTDEHALVLDEAAGTRARPTPRLVSDLLQEMTGKKR